MTRIVYLFCFGLSENSRETPSPPKTPPRGGVEPDSGHTTPRGSSWDPPLPSIIIGVLRAPGEGFGSEEHNRIRADPPGSGAETLPVELQSLLSRTWRPSQTFIFGFCVILWYKKYYLRPAPA